MQWSKESQQVQNTPILTVIAWFFFSTFAFAHFEMNWFTFSIELGFIIFFFYTFYIFIFILVFFLFLGWYFFYLQVWLKFQVISNISTFAIFSSHLKRLSTLDSSWVVSAGYNGLAAHNSPSWLSLYLSVCKLLDLSLALPAQHLPQFQMYQWAFVSEGNENNNITDASVSSAAGTNGMQFYQVISNLIL